MFKSINLSCVGFASTRRASSGAQAITPWILWAGENGIYSLSSGSCFSPNLGGKAFVSEAVKQD